MSDTAFNNLLIHTCTIKRRVYDSSTVDEWGAASESFTTKSSSEVCRFQQTDEDVEFNRRGEKIVTRVLFFMKPTADIQVDDIITYDSIEYRVIGVDPLYDEDSLHHYEVFVVSLENE